MAGDATETRKRLLAAATEEFATRGIAGARVDRIAAEAGANKSLIYSYFGSKDGLFAAVYDAQVVLTVDAVPFTADDLPGYAGRLYDHYRSQPTVYRLTAWARLERDPEAAPIAAITASNTRKIAAIEAEQTARRLSKRFSPQELLGIVLSIAGMWNATSPEYWAAADGPEVGRRQRESVVEAVKLVLG